MKTRIVLVATLLLQACWFKKAPQAPKVPISRPTVTRTPPSSPPSPAPEPAPPASTVTAPPTVTIPAPSRRRAPAAAAPKPSNAPAPRAQLGMITSAQERERLEREIETNLKAASAVLSQASRVTLTPAQKEIAGRVAAFIQQSQNMRAENVFTAAELSRRAAVLSQDLSKALRP